MNNTMEYSLFVLSVCERENQDLADLASKRTYKTTHTRRCIPTRTTAFLSVTDRTEI